jgi:hypothetical protein
MSSAIRTHPARLFLITDKQHSAPPRVVLRLIAAPLLTAPAPKARRSQSKTRGDAK